MSAFVKNDGGRAAAGFNGATGDCVVRAIAVATGLPYAKVYADVNEHAKGERKRVGRARSSARTGVHTTRKWFRDYMVSLGWVWHPTMAIGSGCKVHLRADELPAGRLIVALSRHMTAVIDGVIHDTYDPSRNGTRCVYGYWTSGAAIMGQGEV